ncbi:isoprenyl transferase [Arenicella xantha]|uniref:Ditrans,polycis-undecaprenyl-diphosphate synthase ((2E,6E)-farnesyl-diphosphate specific) n=1 Tax=Arenicella xantha TaxID=644221 RepID=A0A395JKI6_9GAMM|nr:isoprenyl transferase [Arenicella xantha]RBP50945.1 undecaprenyl pyrophosphate synthetase [Arenicella xantha]
MLTKLRSLFRLLRVSQPAGVAIITPKPQHVAVIMDGNGRWANSQGLSRVAGHKRGVDSVKALIKSCLQHEIPYLSIFAFSSENWRRPQSEIDALMDLLANALETQTKKLNENGVRLQLLGDLSRFSPRIQQLAASAQQATSSNEKLVFNVAINYGGRWDITQACRRLAERVANGDMRPDDIDEEAINGELTTAGIPDPDLFIRTSGEYRISNFLLWQAAYSEFYFTDTLWPDFDENAFTEALLKFTRRDRRFGTAQDMVDSAGHGNESTMRPATNRRESS